MLIAASGGGLDIPSVSECSINKKWVNASFYAAKFIYITKVASHFLPQNIRDDY